MGREIRRVIPNWEHPRIPCPHSPWQGGCQDAREHGGKCFQPLLDRSYKEASQEWKAGFWRWEQEDHDEQWWDYDGPPPDQTYHRPDWDDAERTWFQVYETVSEGTPVTPPFPTKEALIEYLVTHGDFSDQWNGNGGWPREAAESFAEQGFAVSIVAVQHEQGIKIYLPRDGQPS